MYQSPYCCIMVHCCAVLLCPFKGLNDVRLIDFDILKVSEQKIVSVFGPPCTLMRVCVCQAVTVTGYSSCVSSTGQYRLRGNYRPLLQRPVDHTHIMFNPLDPRGNYSATSNNTKLVQCTLAVNRWAVTFGTARKGLGGLRPRPVPSLLCRM